MARKPLTPPINCEGTFICLSPFELPQGVIYRLDAIRTFPELERNNKPVYDTYYAPHNITQADYKADAAASASILVFKANDGEVRYVPNTYLSSYPGLTGLKYNRNVLVVDLALLPDYVDVQAFTGDFTNYLQGKLGILPTPYISTMRYEGQVDNAQHVEMESKRKQNIRDAVPLEEQVATLQKRADDLQKLNDELMKIAASKG
ncbi:hypothetical protein pEaSNUABM38_00186 [Erwinia phage pEa_SNUABM_38]|nr:hypothetical protein pEaSNUABM38_00186 [Erwinia phage pEa_SNUABM_38]